MSGSVLDYHKTESVGDQFTVVRDEAIFGGSLDEFGVKYPGHFRAGLLLGRGWAPSETLESLYRSLNEVEERWLLQTLAFVG